MIRSTAHVAILAAFGSLISLLNQLVIARIFGAGADLDAYFVGISVPLTIAGLASSVLAYQVVPALQREADQDGFSGALRAMLLGIGGGSLLIGLIGVAATMAFIPLLSPRLTPSSRELAVQAASIAWLWLPGMVVGAILTGALHVRGRFALATFAQSLPAFGAMAGCLLGHRVVGVLSLAWGQLGGSMLMLFILYFSLPLSTQAPRWMQTRRIVREGPSALGALLVFTIYPFSDAIWGPFAGSSGVSLLGYAQRLIVGFSGLAVVAATTVIFPRLARHASAKASGALRADLAQALRVMFACITPAAAVFGVLALPIVQLLLMRGAFRETDAQALAGLLPGMLVGMVAMSGMGLVFKALFAQGQVTRAAALSVAGACIYFSASGLFVHWLGLPGIGFAYALSWWTMLIASAKSWHTRSSFPPGYIFRLLLITAMCGVPPWLLMKTVFSNMSQDRLLLGLGVSGFSAFASFSFTCIVWPGVDEIRSVYHRLVGQPVPKRNTNTV